MTKKQMFVVVTLCSLTCNSAFAQENNSPVNQLPPLTDQPNLGIPVAVLPTDPGAVTDPATDPTLDPSQDPSTDPNAEPSFLRPVRIGAGALGATVGTYFTIRGRTRTPRKITHKANEELGKMQKEYDVARKGKDLNKGMARADRWKHRGRKVYNPFFRDYQNTSAKIESHYTKSGSTALGGPTMRERQVQMLGDYQRTSTATQNSLREYAFLKRDGMKFPPAIKSLSAAKEAEKISEKLAKKFRRYERRGPWMKKAAPILMLTSFASLFKDFNFPEGMRVDGSTAPASASDRATKPDADGGLQYSVDRGEGTQGAGTFN